MPLPLSGALSPRLFVPPGPVLPVPFLAAGGSFMGAVPTALPFFLVAGRAVAGGGADLAGLVLFLAVQVWQMSVKPRHFRQNSWRQLLQ